MKKLSWKGFTVTMLSLTVMSSMVACSSETNDTNEGTTAPTSKAESTATTDVAPVTIKIYGPKISGAASGVQSDEVAKEIEKRLGIIMDIDPNPEDNKLNLMLAGGELPDLFMVSKDKIKQLVEGNNVIPMDDLLDKYGKNITAESKKKVDFSRKYFSNGTGKLYFLQGHDGLPSVASGGDYYGNQFTIRWDYYKELGYPPLETQEDLLKVTKQIQDKHPTNEQGKTTYGISPFFEWGMWPLTQHGIYTAGKGMTSEFIDVLPDVTFKSSILEKDSSLWTGAAFNNKAYQMGLLDPDSMTQKFDNANEKSNSNRVQLGLVQWMFDQANQGFAKNQELKGYMNIPPLKDGYVSIGSYNQMGNDWELWAISKNSKHPEKAMELLNFLNSIEGAELIANGIKDKHWEEINGKPALKEDRIKAEQADPEFINKTGIKKYQNYLLHSLTVIDPKYKVPINFTPTIEYQKNNLTPLQKDYTAHYGVQLPNEATDKKVQSGQASYNSYNGLYYSLLPTNVPDDIKRIGDSVKGYIEKNIAKVILAKNDDEFAKAKQKMIDDLLKAGLQKHYDYWIAEYNKAKAEADAYGK